MENLNDKVFVVTGGAGFLGRTFVRCIVEGGGIAVIADIDVEAASRLAVEISTAHAGRVEAVKLDISNKQSVTELIASLQKRHGHIDAVVNSSYPRNQNYGRKLEDVTYEDFCGNVNLHLGGYFHVAQQFALHFQKNGGGNIINIGSIYGAMAPRFEIYADTPMTMPVEYAAIKSAIIQLTKYFAQYFKKDGIRVNCISPGGILDKQAASFLQQYKNYCGTKGMLDPSDIVGALLFLLSDSSKYITGQNFIVDDGFSL